MKFATFKQDGTLDQKLIKGVHVIPKAAIEISDELFNRMMCEDDGVWTLKSNGDITKSLKSEVPVTREEIERQRLAAYAHPYTGSDRYFAEANRMQEMGEPGWEAVKEQAIARFKELQALFPWPDDEAAVKTAPSISL